MASSNQPIGSQTREASPDAFHRELFGTVQQSTSVLSWGNSGRVSNNGSVFFIDTGKVLMAVTARHVYHAYVEAALKAPHLCYIDNLPFDPIRTFLSEGKDVDIATFRITPAELKTLGELTMPWPPIIPEPGKSVILAGWPGVGRSSPAPAKVHFRCYIAMFGVDNVNDLSISMMKPPNSELVDIVGKGLPPAQFDIGGMSGGPIAAVLKTPSGLITWQLSAVIYEGHQTFEIFKGARADFIGDDGNVK